MLGERSSSCKALPTTMIANDDGKTQVSARKTATFDIVAIST
jgi:hypothetical protein